MSGPTSRLARGQRIFVGASSNEPAGLLEALVGQDVPSDLEFIQFPVGGMNTFDFTALDDTARVTTFFMTPTLARAADPRRVRFLPMQMRSVFDYVARHVDVALLQVALDRQGVLRLGPNVDFVDAALERAELVIAELNHGIVAPAGCPMISKSRIDYLVETERAPAELPPRRIDAAAETIGGHVAGLIEDGDCIQTGIGAIPAAILARLSDRSDLGLHGGLIDDAGRALIEAGNVTGARKPVDTGLHVTAMALGTHPLYEWLADRPDVVFRGANHTHEVAAIRRLPNFVSVNSAVEVDLYGQMNAEFAGGRQISGTGGSVDFMRAAKASPGGRSIVAMNATARGGTVSRIVPRVELVTALRTDIDIVVTEFGVAHLKHLPLAARARALVEIAAPGFRDELAEAAARLG